MYSCTATPEVPPACPSTSIYYYIKSPLAAEKIPVLLNTQSCSDNLHTPCNKRTSLRCFFLYNYIISRTDLKFVHVLPIFIKIRQYLAHLAQSENTQSKKFPWGRLKIYISLCSLRALIYIIRLLTWFKYWPYSVLINCRKVLAHSLNTLNAAKFNQRNKILNLYILGWMVWW